jgi:hypothetical protein
MEMNQEAQGRKNISTSPIKHAIKFWANSITCVVKSAILCVCVRTHVFERVSCGLLVR